MTPADDARFETALAAWGPGVWLGECLGGNRNDVRLVHVGSTRYAARLSARPADALAWELDLLDHLRGAGMVVPGYRPTPDGRRHVQRLVLFEWLDGEPPISDGDWLRVAETLRHLHALTRDWPQRPGFRSTQALLVYEAGGDVRLDLMPRDAVEACRVAWRVLADEPQAVIHGDPGAGNIRVSSRGVGLIDWDEARVDACILDLASLPLDQLDSVEPHRLGQARRALDAWEAANGWVPEPEYARRRLARLLAAQ